MLQYVTRLPLSRSTSTCCAGAVSRIQARLFTILNIHNNCLNHLPPLSVVQVSTSSVVHVIPKFYSASTLASRSTRGPSYYESTSNKEERHDDYDHDGSDDDLISAEQIQQWSSQHQTYARNILIPPPPPTAPLLDVPSSTSTDFNITTFKDYLRWRKWNTFSTHHDNDHHHRKNKQDNKDGHDDDYCNNSSSSQTQIQQNMAHALLSHTLTFPLTLAHNLDHFLVNLVQHQQPKHDRDAITTVRLCCIGARAEANLPLKMWREFLIYTTFKHLNIACCSGSGTRNINYIIDFIGPDIPKSMKTRSISYNSHELIMNYHSGYFHQYIYEDYKKKKEIHHDAANNINNSNEDNKDDNNNSKNNSNNIKITTELLNKWDGFILFNPGIGHDHLKKAWMPTLRFILKTNKAIISTAHSKLDSERDLMLWKDFILSVHEQHQEEKERDECRFGDYESNIFASKMAFKDPFTTLNEKNDDNGSNCGGDSVHIVNPNHSILKIHPIKIHSVK